MTRQQPEMTVTYDYSYYRIVGDYIDCVLTSYSTTFQLYCGE